MKNRANNFFMALLVTCASFGLFATKAAHAELGSTLTVTDAQGAPIAGAVVMIGTETNKPFAGNMLTTNASGEIVTPAQWTTPLPVTIQKEGFVTSTFFNIEAKAQKFVLTFTEGQQKIKVSGKAKEFGRLRTDGKVDFSLVIPTFKRTDILRFDLGQVISPEGDTLDLGVAKFDLPSNVTLPKQTESYIIPINLEKEVYRTFVRSQGEYQFTATHGQFPLQQVVKAFREGKSIFEIANYFEFIQYGTADLSIAGDTVTDIAVNQKVFDQTFTLKAPQIAANMVMVGMGLQLDGDRLYPTDLKSFKSNEQKTLKTIGTKEQQYTLALLTENVKKDPTFLQYLHKKVSLPNLLNNHLFTPQSLAFDDVQPNNSIGEFDLNKMSFALSKADGSIPKFIDFAAPPVVEGTSLVLAPPPPVAGLLNVATLVIYSEVEVTTVDKVTTEKRTRLWELTSQGWVNRISLPTLPQIRDTNKKYRWEVLFLGQAEGQTPGSITDLSAITHVSRSQLDL
jgi:hypothetical protein